MRTDSEIKKDVLEQLKWQANIDETKIGVIVKDRIVTLTGLVFSYAIKIEVEEAVKKVVGVNAIVEDIKVGYISSLNKTDTEIANSAVHALEWNASVPNGKVVIGVEDGWITMLGELKWAYQRDAASRTVEYLKGVKGVTNNITLRQQINTQDVKKKITKAFERSADIDAENITIKVDGQKVKLTGKVHSLSKKNEAQKVAYNAPGVTIVENDLEVL